MLIEVLDRLVDGGAPRVPIHRSQVFGRRHPHGDRVCRMHRILPHLATEWWPRLRVLWRGRVAISMGGEDRSGVVTDVGDASHRVVAHGAWGARDGQLSTRASVASAHSTTALVRWLTRSKTRTLWWMRSGYGGPSRTTSSNTCARSSRVASAWAAHRADRGEELLLGAVLGEEDLECSLRLEEDAAAGFGKPVAQHAAPGGADRVARSAWVPPISRCSSRSRRWRGASALRTSCSRHGAR